MLTCVPPRARRRADPGRPALPRTRRPSDRPASRSIYVSFGSEAPRLATLPGALPRHRRGARRARPARADGDRPRPRGPRPAPGNVTASSAGSTRPPRCRTRARDGRPRRLGLDARRTRRRRPARARPAVRRRPGRTPAACRSHRRRPDGRPTPHTCTPPSPACSRTTATAQRPHGASRPRSPRCRRSTRSTGRRAARRSASPESSNSISKMPSMFALKAIFATCPALTSLHDVVAVDVDLLVLAAALHAEAHGVALVEAQLADRVAGEDRARVDGRLRGGRRRRRRASRPRRRRGLGRRLAVASPSARPPWSPGLRRSGAAATNATTRITTATPSSATAGAAAHDPYPAARPA